MEYYQPTLERLLARAGELSREWSEKQPFHYLIIDNFLADEFAEAIYAAYPNPEAPGWDGVTYIHQRKKLTRTSDFSEPVAHFFKLTAATEFRQLFSGITGIPNLLDDPDLVGGGLHQILRGGFLDVHVDFNLHPRTKLYRRLNLLLYMNKDWRPEYEGCLELWDMAAKRQLEKIAPVFNRAVLFETNEISYHGHPRPLNTPPEISRRSLAIYYYTKEQPNTEVAVEHNTLYRQTTGLHGYVKSLLAGTKAASERFSEHGLEWLGGNLIKRTYRRLQGLPPENK